jgi:hypothetical protein
MYSDYTYLTGEYDEKAQKAKNTLTYPENKK